MRIVRDEAVDRGPEAVPQAGEAGHLPEVGEKLFDLPLQAVDVSPRHRVSVPGCVGFDAWRACG